jgi:hypothetical protein
MAIDRERCKARLDEYLTFLLARILMVKLEWVVEYFPLYVSEYLLRNDLLQLVRPAGMLSLSGH